MRRRRSGGKSVIFSSGSVACKAVLLDVNAGIRSGSPKSY
jgi:hypothetical protein